MIFLEDKILVFVRYNLIFIVVFVVSSLRDVIMLVIVSVLDVILYGIVLGIMDLGEKYFGKDLRFILMFLFCFNVDVIMKNVVVN